MGFINSCLLQDQKRLAHGGLINRCLLYIMCKHVLVICRLSSGSGDSMSVDGSPPVRQIRSMRLFKPQMTPIVNNPRRRSAAAAALNGQQDNFCTPKPQHHHHHHQQQQQSNSGSSSTSHTKRLSANINPFTPSSLNISSSLKRQRQQSSLKGAM